MAIRPTAAALVHAGRRTCITKLIGAFRDRANAPKSQSTSLHYLPSNLVLSSYWSKASYWQNFSTSISHCNDIYLKQVL